MKIKLFVLLILLLVALSGNSQQNINRDEIRFFKYSYQSQDINIKQSEHLQNYFETLKGLHKARKGFYGYRVKIFAENNRNARDRANNLRLNFNSGQDTIRAYVVYTEPNFEVHIGDFRTRFEAVSVLNKIEGRYPEAYIVKSIINFPNL